MIAIPKGMIESQFKQTPICSHFGCNKKLSLVEQLSGSKCLQHIGIKKIDITKIIKL